MVCTNWRRERRPVFTSFTRLRMSRSSMKVLLAGRGASAAGEFSTLSALLEHPHGDVERLDHALVVGDALPRAVEGRAVIHRYPEERQTHGDVDAAEAGPRLARVVVRETDGLDRDVALVVVHRDDDVELTAAGPREQGVRGQRADHGQSLGARRLDGRHDRVLLLVAEE